MAKGNIPFSLLGFHLTEVKTQAVDDWAKRRGHVYGTIVVDLQRRQVIDLLEARTAETLEKCLRSKRKRSSANELAKKERMKRSQDLHTAIHRLYKAGISKRAIARQLGKHRATINKHLEVREYPPDFTRKRVASILDPYEDNLAEVGKRVVEMRRSCGVKFKKRDFQVLANKWLSGSMKDGNNSTLQRLTNIEKPLRRKRTIRTPQKHDPAILAVC